MHVCIRVVWVDFSSARVIAGHEGFAADVFAGTSEAELESLYEADPANTASNAVLRGADARPADEGCAMIYCALQHLLKKNQHFRMMEPGKEKAFANERAGAFRQYHRIPEASSVIARILAALNKLGERREIISAEEIRSEVRNGLAGAFELFQWVSRAAASKSPPPPLPVGSIKKRRFSNAKETS